MASEEEDIKTIASMDLLFAKFSDLFDDFATGKKGKATEVRNAIRNIKFGIKVIEKNLGLTPINRTGKEKEFSEDYRFVDDAISRFMEKSGKDISPLVEAEKTVRDIMTSQGLVWDDRNRKPNSAYFRIAVTYFVRNKGYTLHEIGKFLGKDHSTVQHYINKASTTIENPLTDPVLAKILEEITTFEYDRTRTTSARAL